MVINLSKHGHYNPQLDYVLKQHDEGLIHLNNKTNYLSFSLSEYGGTMDVLIEFLEAMERFNPPNKNELNIRDFAGKHDLFERIYQDYETPMEQIRQKKFQQAVQRGCEILEFIFKDVSFVYLLFKGPEEHLSTVLQFISRCLKGPKECSQIQPAPDLYSFDGEPLYLDAIKMLYKHPWEKFKVRQFVKNIVYGVMALSPGKTSALSFYVIAERDEPTIAHMYDDRGMCVWADGEILRALKTRFADWIR